MVWHRKLRRHGGRSGWFVYDEVSNLMTTQDHLNTSDGGAEQDDEPWRVKGGHDWAPIGAAPPFEAPADITNPGKALEMLEPTVPRDWHLRSRRVTHMFGAPPWVATRFVA